MSEDAGDHIPHEDAGALASATIAHDLGNAFPRDALEDVSKNSPNENLSEDVPSIGIFFKDSSDNVACPAAIDGYTLVCLVILERDTSFS